MSRTTPVLSLIIGPIIAGIIGRMHPLERLLNLVALLLNSSRPLTFEEIRAKIPAYQQDDVASAKRMFERDKDALREVGVPVDLAATDVWEVERGYRIVKEHYYLPDIGFSPDEMWALFVAAHAPGADGEAEQAFHKLSSAADANLLTAIADRAPAPGIDVSGPHLGAVADALARRRRIRFRYRPSQGRAGQRTVDPHALVFRKGNWYLVGLDAEREEVRSYRLSRLRSTVKEVGPAAAAPEGFDAVAHLAAGPWGLGEPAETARIAFTEKVAWLVAASTPGAVPRPSRGGWIDVDVPAGQTESFVSWVLSFGPDARVVSPKGLREEVVRRLQSLATTGASG
jgi:proteasome accessory factor B